MIDWDDVRYFLAVARGGSVRAAAERLGVNHSTVLRRVAQLEERLGALMFEKLPSGYRLTAAGEEVLELADQMEVSSHQLETRVFGRDQGVRGHKPHIAMSVTKSFTGVLAGILVTEGKIDPQALVPDYVPELKASAFGDARVHEVMDMTTGLEYTEVYTDKNSHVWGLRRANGMAPIPPDYDGATNIFDFLAAQKKQGEHGKAFAYKTVNTDVLAWICRRVSGMTLSDLLSERVWTPMGAEEDAHYHVDRIGTESGGGGLSTSLRDLARFGETMRNHGRFNGRQIVPSQVVEDIARGGDPEKFKPAGYTTLPGASYRNQWWVTHNAHGAYMARGVHGQGIYVDPKAEMVIARYASHPVAGNAANDPVTLPAYMALAKELMAGG
ncbi:serine hydrolase [Bradyrhizobium sp. 61]|uniref:serine hydrolase domain-containing protein n=1 Tax=Bradyrhizobium sp. 61 TaxID=2782679 RepID=UPI001FFA367A|nr:serine hydrolase [Bradyrhizobium sp. 61]MCK1277571.1 serine hydrolase [Bradyrhizobium sp. 61]